MFYTKPGVELGQKVQLNVSNLQIIHPDAGANKSHYIGAK